MTAPPPPPPPHHPAAGGAAPPPGYPAPGLGAPAWGAPPAGPAPGVAYAGFWIRLLAYLIDGVITGIPVGITWALIAGAVFSSFHCSTVFISDSLRTFHCTGGNFSLLAIPYSVGLVVPFVYFTIMWSRFGRSLGQRALGLHVVDAYTGGRISAGRALVRYLGVIVSSWVLFIGLIWAGFDARKQGWHDKMANTFVVRRV